MRKLLDVWAGSKTYLLIIIMGVLAVLESNFGITVPDIVYQMLGLGAGVTAKMAIDRMSDKPRF